MFKGNLGRVYENGEPIVCQGATDDDLHFILEGQVEVVHVHQSGTRRLAVLQEGDFFGEMEIFDASARSATVRALGQTRILTVDKKTLLKRLQEDPSLALHFLQTLSSRLRSSSEIA